MSDTPTPGTDAVAYDVGGEQHAQGSVVSAEFARGLERELASLKQKYGELCNAVMKGHQSESSAYLDPVEIVKMHRAAWKAL